jgi:16S rRNA processing protein RimM
LVVSFFYDYILFMDFIHLGKITGTHGLDGNVVLYHHQGKLNGLKQLKHIFIELKRESYIPFFIEQIRVDNDSELFLKLEEVDTVEEAKAISGKAVYLSTAQYEQLKPKDKDINFVGFEVWDEAAGKLGKVAHLFETPGQLLATVEVRGKEAIVPLNEQTIRSVDIAAKTLKLCLPDGLLDIYMDE